MISSCRRHDGSDGAREAAPDSAANAACPAGALLCENFESYAEGMSFAPNWMTDNSGGMLRVPPVDGQLHGQAPPPPASPVLSEAGECPGGRVCCRDRIYVATLCSWPPARMSGRGRHHVEGRRHVRIARRRRLVLQQLYLYQATCTFTASAPAGHSSNGNPPDWSSATRRNWTSCCWLLHGADVLALCRFPLFILTAIARPTFAR